MFPGIATKVDMSRKIAENEYYVQKRWLKAKGIILVENGAFDPPTEDGSFEIFQFEKKSNFIKGSFSNWKITRKTNAKKSSQDIRMIW